jgi:probable HAF family extracellular repeat protein
VQAPILYEKEPFLYENGNLWDLNQLIPENSGWILKEATDINNDGQIVGSGEIDGEIHAFLLTPIKDSDDRGGGGG